ncbi:MAG: UTP--glucose-1-phosphate uridylyltransferase [Planctomycetota bacterium]|nr:UTP--glucose-1-phosphate uridylyltransferase [Planctomycetota bacterium]
MSSRLIEVIESDDHQVRNTPLDTLCNGLSRDQLLAECATLDRFRKDSPNLYHRVRALFFNYSIHRFYLPRCPDLPALGKVSFSGYTQLLDRRFEEAIDLFLAEQARSGPSDTICSALAQSYHQLAFQTLANQVRRSVRSAKGNQWMFRIGHPTDHPLRIRHELLQRNGDGPYPLLREQTSVRMDLSHSAWSDIFFLGMDYPEAARVLNVSVDLAVHGRDPQPEPPIEAWFRVIDEPVLRLISVDLGTTADITELEEVFDYAKDYLGLLKAAVISAGVVPPGMEGSGESLSELLARLTGPGRGIEVVSHVRDIPKGSRLAVSTNLLGSLIAVCMRATGQTENLAGGLTETERRTVAARAILGEWLGGSGGGWQDSGGIWPGMKLITGQLSEEGDPEFGISRGKLLPGHRILGEDDASQATRRRLQDSMVLVHGGMAQNVGPVLEMVTEKYLLRGQQEWDCRQDALQVLEEIMQGLRDGDTKKIAAATSRNFEGPIQGIIPWASNLFTESIIDGIRKRHGSDYHGFCMLGGMSGGGMGFLFDPEVRDCARNDLLEIMTAAKRDLQNGLPFAMDPLVYDFEINEHGTLCTMLTGDDALLPAHYYTLIVPDLLQRDRRELPALRRAELNRFGSACRNRPELKWVVGSLFNQLFPRLHPKVAEGESLADLLTDNGFDPRLHEQIRSDLLSGRIGLAQNRLPANTDIQDTRPEDVVDTLDNLSDEDRQAGSAALAAGEVAVVTLAAGTGSRWTQGAGVVKAINPFCRLAGSHRTFIEVHLAKSRRTGAEHGALPPHVFTTSYLTHDPIIKHLQLRDNYKYEGPVQLSAGRAVGQRLIPMERDLKFAWEELSQQLLDEQAQKVLESLHSALIDWAREAGESSDYTDNLPHQCLHPVGHWFEVPGLLRNGTLERILADQPQLQHLLLHNIDTLGANLDPGLLGSHIRQGSTLSFEVIPRRIDDRGGGLALVDGQPRLLEGLAMPREEDEFKLSYYNSLTTWIHIDSLLDSMGLTRADLPDTTKVDNAVRQLSNKMPTYVTIKEVKKRWGQGQEDIFPVTQFEKLWGDMSAVPGLSSSFFVVPRMRGQQLKDPAQLDGWLRDGSAAHIESLCAWTDSEPAS